jgi:hypothetical protein
MPAATLRPDVLDWLLEDSDPGVRHLTLRDVLDRPADDARVLAARAAAHTTGPIGETLDAMHPAGYWARPGAGYTPKYFAGVWSILTLAQCGAHIDADPRLRTACDYMLDHSLLPDGIFSLSETPDYNFDCLHGNLLASLLALGCTDDRLTAGIDWAARLVTGEGVAPATDRQASKRFGKYNTGPGFACRANNGKPCAWGAIKLMWAFSQWPVDWRTPLIDRAIAAGVDFLLGTDPAQASYPVREDGDPPSERWWLFGFPVFYVTDMLQNLEALVGLGYGADPRLQAALDLVEAKQDAAGRWPLEYKYYRSQVWHNVGRKNAPNKWVTLRAVRMLKRAGRLALAN